MQNAQTTGIQFQKDEVIHCPSCEQLMRAPCEAAALRCASCRAVINPQDCVRSGAEGVKNLIEALKSLGEAYTQLTAETWCGWALGWGGGA